MQLRRVAAVATLVIAAMVTSAAPPVPAAQAQQAWPGEFSAPFAEDPTFNARPPRTIEEAMRTPTAIHMAMLPDGRITYWDGWGQYGEERPIVLDGFRGVKPATSRILDLRSGAPQWSAPGNNRGGPNDDESLFCTDQRVLPDGRLLAIGGQIIRNDPVDLEPITGDDGPSGTFEIYGTTATRWIDPHSSQPAWVGGEEHRMHTARWYPSTVTLPDGRVLVASGTERLIYNAPPLEDGNGRNVVSMETFDYRTDRWTLEPASADISLPLYPRLHVMHDGKVLYPANGMMWSPFGAAADEAIWAAMRAYDPATRQWTVAGVGSYGARSDAFSVPLMLQPPYDRTRLLMGGGSLGVAPTAYLGTALSEVVTYRDGVALSVPTAPLNNRRWFSSGVLLPNGQVLALSGGDQNSNVVFGSDAPVRQAEVFDPGSGSWTPLASGSRDRAYHNSAILLPDGRVLVGGHAPQPDLDGVNDPGGPTADAGLTSNNLKDSSFEIFTPPYLDPSRGPRPRILFARAGMAYAGAASTPYPVTVSGDVSKVVLVRLPSTTHTVDADQRGIELAFDGAGQGALHVTAPPNGNVAPPGYYYLFALSPSGVPSKARIVQVGANPSETGAAPAPFGA